MASTTPVLPTPAERATLSPSDARALFRAGLVTPTPGFSAGYAQANLITLPREDAFDFLIFAQRNPKPCPLLGVLEPGETSSDLLTGGDIRTDIPGYRVFRNGELTEERDDVTDLWRDDLVSFIIGCSFTFETALLDNGVPVAHIDQGRNVPMFRTNYRNESGGTVPWPDGGLDASHSRRTGRRRRAYHVPLPLGPRRSGPRR
jgi:uncharacterized protein YcsI (UPF0317 family)